MKTKERKCIEAIVRDIKHNVISFSDGSLNQGAFVERTNNVWVDLTTLLNGTDPYNLTKI